MISHLFPKQQAKGYARPIMNDFFKNLIRGLVPPFLVSSITDEHQCWKREGDAFATVEITSYINVPIDH